MSQVAFDRDDAKLLSRALLALVAILFIKQLTALYTTPIPDSYLWWGDDHQAMLEARTMIEEGIYRDPHALGSSIEIGNGLIRGNVWITGAIYGSAEAVFRNISDPVTIGRTVTAVLAALLLVAVYFSARKFGVSEIASALALLLLVSTRSFFFTSHSTRYDILTTLTLLSVTVYLSLKFEKYRAGSFQPSPFWFGLVTFAGLGLVMVSSHIATLLGPFYIYALVRFGLFRRVANVVWAVSGIFAIGALLVGLLWLSTGELSLLGTHGQPSTFVNVVEERPILRFYSRSVQVANLVQRAQQVWMFARWFLIAAIACLPFFWINRQTSEHKTARSFFGWGALLVLFCWLENEGSAASSYLIYALPIGAVLVAFGIERVLHSQLLIRLPIVLRQLTVSGIALLLFALGFNDVTVAKKVGDELTANNEAVLSAATKLIDTTGRPVVLAYNPAINWFLARRDVFGMSTHFYEMPATALPVAEVLKKEKVAYVATYANSWKHDFMREAEPIQQVADSLGSLLFEHVGAFTDIGRSYFDESVRVLDTFRFYKFSTKR